MINMQPVLKRGYAAWDRATLPSDEFSERVRLVRAEMEKDGLRALLIWGSGYHSYPDFAYLSGMNSGGTLMLTQDTDPSIFTGGGGREVPFQKTLTWIQQISAAGAGLNKALRASLEAQHITDGKIGTVGVDALSPAGYESLVQDLANYQLQDFDAQLRRVRAGKRPREVLAVRTALRIATDAAAAGVSSFASGGSNAHALVEAERSARYHKARDFRALANVAGDDLGPYESASDEHRGPLLMWLAVEYQGYWADIAVTSPDAPGSDAERAIQAMVEAARPGMAAGELANAALRTLSPAAGGTALEYGLGNGIGLTLEESPSIRPDSTEALAEGSLLSLRVLARDATTSFASALVQVLPTGAQRLTPRDSLD